MLYTIFIRKTNLKLDLLSFNIFGSSEYEKMDIFLKQLNFVLLTKNFLRLLTYNKKYKNCLQPNLLIFPKCLVVLRKECVQEQGVLCFDKFYHPFHFMFDFQKVLTYIYIYNIYTTNLLRLEQVCLMMFNERYSFERYFFHHWA